MATSLQRQLEEISLEQAASAVAPRITLSIGIATCIPRLSLSLTELMDAAD